MSIIYEKSMKVKGNGITRTERRIFKGVDKKKHTYNPVQKKVWNADRKLIEAQESLEDTVLSNYGYHLDVNGKEVKKPIVLTLTSSPGMSITPSTDITRFVERLKKKGYGSIKYSYVHGIQAGRDLKEGLHIHMVIYNIGFIDLDILNKSWPKGRVAVTTCVNAEQVARYFKKNMKEIKEHREALGIKKYFNNSRELLTPEIIKDQELVEALEIALEDNKISLDTNKIYVNDFGITHIRKYTSKATTPIHDIIQSIVEEHKNKIKPKE